MTRRGRAGGGKEDPGVRRLPGMRWRLLWLLSAAAAGCCWGLAAGKTLRGGFASATARREPWRPVAHFQFHGGCPEGGRAGQRRLCRPGAAPRGRGGCQMPLGRGGTGGGRRGRGVRSGISPAALRPSLLLALSFPLFLLLSPPLRDVQQVRSAVQAAPQLGRGSRPAAGRGRRRRGGPGRSSWQRPLPAVALGAEQSSAVPPFVSPARADTPGRLSRRAEALSLPHASLLASGNCPKWQFSRRCVVLVTPRIRL